LTLHVVYLNHRQLAPKVRAFIDYLVEAIGPRPYWENWKKAPSRARKARPRGV
jgi:hypothetical protein